jgi:hypothetical protein
MSAGAPAALAEATNRRPFQPRLKVGADLIFKLNLTWTKSPGKYLKVQLLYEYLTFCGI